MTTYAEAISKDETMVQSNNALRLQIQRQDKVIAELQKENDELNEYNKRIEYVLSEVINEYNNEYILNEIPELNND